MSFKTIEPEEHPHDTPSDTQAHNEGSDFRKALRLFHNGPSIKKLSKRTRKSGKQPYLSFRGEILFFPGQQTPIDLETFLKKRPGLHITYHSEYETFRTMRRNGKSLPARQYAMATVIRPHGGYDYHIRMELPKEHQSLIGDVASFIQLFPNGVPGISESFIFYLGDIDIRLQWSSSERWDMSVARSSQVGQVRDRGSKILYPLITTKR